MDLALLAFLLVQEIVSLQFLLQLIPLEDLNRFRKGRALACLFRVVRGPSTGIFPIELVRNLLKDLLSFDEDQTNGLLEYVHPKEEFVHILRERYVCIPHNDFEQQVHGKVLKSVMILGLGNLLLE